MSASARKGRAVSESPGHPLGKAASARPVALAEKPTSQDSIRLGANPARRGAGPSQAAGVPASAIARSISPPFDLIKIVAARSGSPVPSSQ